MVRSPLDARVNLSPPQGPMLVCVPLSTIGSWQKEFATWAPNINMVSYVGENTSRKIIRKFECKNDKGDLTFNVLLTNYEMVNKDSSFFQGISWSNIVVDEAHRLKNHESSLFKVKSTQFQLNQAQLEADRDLSHSFKLFLKLCSLVFSPIELLN